MKKKLLYLTSILLFSAASINAQTTSWNFSNNTVSVDGNVTVASPAFPTAGVLTSGAGGVAGTSPNTIQVGGLNLYGHTASGASAFANITGSNQTFPDGYVGSNRANLGGGGAAATGTFLPTVRYFTFNASGPCTVKVWIKHTTAVPVDPIATPPTTRTLLVTNGTTYYGGGSVTNDVTANLSSVATVNVTSAGLVYIYADTSLAIYKIESKLVSLATDSFQAESSVVVYAKDGKINLSNVTSATKVSVYNLLGSLVKSAEVDSDASLDINNGVYIVKLQSAEGEKTVKVIVQ